MGDEPKNSNGDLKIITSKTQGKKVAFISGYFNLLHPGHLRLLRFAKECSDYLVVGLLPSVPELKDSTVSESLRLEGVLETSWVDHAFILDQKPVDFVSQLKPDFVIKGSEFEQQENAEQSVVDSYGGKILFNSGDISFSSIDLHYQEVKKLRFSTIEKNLKFLKRHNIQIQDLSNSLEAVNKLKVLVIGDLIIDEYIKCEPQGMSREDPTIVVTPLLNERFIGGAGIVAAHAAGLGAKVKLFSVSGQDSLYDFAKEKLDRLGVESFILQDDSRPSTLKQRFRADNKTLLRVNHLRQHDISSQLQKKVFDSLWSHLEGVDLVLFSDFNYGVLPQKLVDNIVNACNKMNIKMMADSQSSSQTGDISRFQNMTLLTPTEREARLGTQDFKSGIVYMVEKLRKKSNSKNIFVTLGTEGLLINSDRKKYPIVQTDQIPSMNFAPKDTAGAGDSLFVTSSLAIASGANIWQSAFLGALAAACQISRLGNIPLTHEELQREIWN